ncbi:VOC family protein [Hoeflea prorocentri]|uniref:VOC family protein n=1 Tax=Hoeflea prorocentri TaxID=1922333 RepID=A0A9X3ZJC5_9HYPH|nr:VOC family protein [Hoeflea prorocentri]MCY6382801.1 VOC family protein [Hoeflea prorocentri]MDA5400601.1 VOC family protein [Hoeflea prorocentri]
MTRPVAINHVGAVVDDIEAAIKWYQDVMGFGLVGGPYDLTSEGAMGAQTRNILGQSLNHLRIAHMAAANGVGLELFEPVDPPIERRDEVIEYWRHGYFHICVTDPDVEDLVARIVETGGKQLSDFWQERPPKKEFRMCYCADPFGNVVEVYSHQYEAMQGSKD